MSQWQSSDRSITDINLNWLLQSFGQFLEFLLSGPVFLSIEYVYVYIHKQCGPEGGTIHVKL